MPKQSRVWSPKKRVKAITLHGEGYSLRAIAAKLGGGATFSGVRKLLDKFKSTGKVEDKKGRGRKRKTTRRADRRLKQLSIANRFFTSRQLLAAWGGHVCPKTVRNRLLEFGLRARRPRRKPLLTLGMRKKRMEWAREHLPWTTDDWKKVLFSDETKINLHSSDGIMYVRRRTGEEFLPSCTLRTVKFPTSVMLWGCMCAGGIGRLHVIQGTVTGEKYIQDILEKKMLPSAADLFQSDVNHNADFVFQQDNASCHTAKRVKDWFGRNGVQVLDWPGNSPDLNPIENLWKRLKVLVAEKQPTNKQQLVEAAINSWFHVITKEELDKLISSMPRRCRAVLKARGYTTKY